MSGKLTKAQSRVLASVADGAVFMRFDVYAGYWWTERGKMFPCYGRSENFPPLPIRYLVEGGLIAKGETQRPASGYHEARYSLTAKGRAALRTLQVVP
jgi:hypothetical protein